MPGTDDRIRRWVEGHVVAGRDQPASADPIKDALDLVDFASQVLGWPLPLDPVRALDDERRREAYARLKRPAAS